jgi:small subunit ribosomal protein S16
MLRIRLRRAGRKNRPTYRIVVAEHSAPLSGKFVAMLGHFDPRTKAVGIETDELMKWLGVGAKPSNRVAKILTAAGVSHKHVVVIQNAKRAPRKAVEETSAPKAPATAEAVTDETASETVTDAVADETAAETPEAPTEPTEEPAPTE